MATHLHSIGGDKPTTSVVFSLGNRTDSLRSTCYFSLVLFHTEFPLSGKDKWLVYLTHWTFVVFVAYLVVCAVNTCGPHTRSSKSYLASGSAAYALFTGAYFVGNGTDPLGETAIYAFLDYGSNTGVASGADCGVVLVLIPSIWMFRSAFPT
ncbi:hypothetical protein RvY_17985 [Ramazzottius varieornatus]|uniref:Uncharacterized protein n=1 Tax=Ramazzottius varieornatus TaxID=947166 RepID=A0A1D1W7R0_RAMVA|nr:hypothetical protein RvY_17985 [Ramazzottius varieornatus]